MQSRKSARGLLLAGVLLAAVSAPAMAQQGAGGAPEPAAAATPDDQSLGEIVVTATKRETNLQKTPIAISVMTSQAIADRHIQSLYDLADGGVPSLRIATFEARQTALTIGIRGIVPLDANQPAREQGVGIYIDGVYLGRQHGLNAALFDVERIEVLKGPQGTLFGRNTEGGALSIVAKAPSGVFGGRMTAGISNYGGYNADAHIDLPEIAGIAIKADGVVQYQGATIKNPLAGSKGWNYFDRRGFRIASRWQGIDGLTVDLAYDNGYDANTPFYSQLLNTNPNGCVAGTQASQPACTLPGTAYTTLSGAVRPVPGIVQVGDSDRAKSADIGVPQQPSVDKTHGYTAHLAYKLVPEVELRSITAWRGVSSRQWDNSGGAHRVPIMNCTTAVCNFSRYSLADLFQHQFSQEFQAVGSAGRLDYAAGLYYFNEHVTDDAATPNSNAYTPATGAITILDPCTGSGGFGSAYGCRNTDRASEVWSKSYAAYGQVTWNATDALHLTVGGRYTRDKKRGKLLLSRNIDYSVNVAAATANGYHPLDKTWNRFNPMATVAYDLNDDMHVYAKYATGYRAGGASSRTANYQPFDPEDVKSYEVGAKADFFDHRARLNVAAYMMDRKKSQVDISSIQTTATGNFNNLVTINAPGTTKIRGIEADLTVRPVTGLTLTASYAYTYTRIPLVPIQNTITVGGVTTTSPVVYQRFYIVFTPRNAASGAIDYALPTGFRGATVKLHLDANYAQATQAFDQFATKADSSFLVNGRLALADIDMGHGDSKLTLSVWARNMFDEAHIFRRDPSNSLPGAPTTSLTTGSIANVLGDYGNFNAPRTFGIEASIKL